MNSKSISRSKKESKSHDELIKRRSESATNRAKRRKQENHTKHTKSKRLKDIFFFVFYGGLLLCFTIGIDYFIDKIL